MFIGLRTIMLFVLLLGMATGALPQSPTTPKRLAADERDALIALYHATGGSQWSDKSGWLGSPGTECEWHGVTCGYPADAEAMPFVESIELSQNNLVGAIPPELGRLKKLQWLSIFFNRLTGRVPESLIERWLSGSLFIAAEAQLLTSVSQIEYEWDAPSVLCASRHTILRSDGTAVEFATLCRDDTPKDRTTYCEVKEGEVTWDEFARLSWLIERAGFFTLGPKYDRSMTHATFEKTRVTRAGKTAEVSNYASAGPFELWGVQRAIEGIAADIEVKQKSRRATCPDW
jgi:hypothetical protein